MAQIAVAFGIRVIVSCRSQDEARFCIGLGVELAVDLNAQKLVPTVMDFTRGRGVDVVVDIGSVPPADNTACLSLEGRLLIMSPMRVESVSVEAIFEKRLTVTGSSIRTREPAYKKHLAHKIREEIWPLVESRKVVPHVHAVVKFTEVPKALNAIEGLPSGGADWQVWDRPVIGKCVCIVERTHGPPTALRSDT